jgi:hypothetical protein
LLTSSEDDESITSLTTKLLNLSPKSIQQGSSNQESINHKHMLCYIRESMQSTQHLPSRTQNLLSCHFSDRPESAPEWERVAASGARVKAATTASNARLYRRRRRLGERWSAALGNRRGERFSAPLPKESSRTVLCSAAEGVAANVDELGKKPIGSKDSSSAWTQ